MKEEKQYIIMKAAKELFQKFGLHKTTVDEIAEKAGVGKGTIYNYYDSKEKIFEDVLEDEVNELKNETSLELQKEQRPDEKLRKYFLLRMTLACKLAQKYTTFKDEYLEYYSFIERIRKKYNEYEFQIIKNILQEGVDKNIFNVKDIELTASTFVMAMKGLEYYWAILTSDNIELLTQKVNTMIDLIFNGMLKK
jgi:AcrR family transcriptional regulator